MRMSRIVALAIALAFVPACGFSSPTGIQDDATPEIEAAGGYIGPNSGMEAAGGYIGPNSSMETAGGYIGPNS
jgi:hypothetical protein